MELEVGVEERYRTHERDLFRDAGIEPRERWVRLGRTGTRARVLDVGDGAPVLFLHGGPWAAAGWAYVAAALPGVRCLLLDRPGCGLSDPPPRVPDASSLPGYATALTADVLDALGIEQAALVGSSLGGYSALRSAAAYPDRIRGVVLAGCPAFVPGWAAPTFFTILRLPLLGRAFLALPVTAASTRMTLRQLGHGRSLDNGLLPEALLRWVSAWQRDTRTMAHDAAMIRACGTWRDGFDAGLDLQPEDLARVAAPCHILAATDDPVGGVDVAARLASLLPRATVEVWEGAGHLPWLDDPVRAASSIGRFVRETSSTPLPRADRDLAISP